AALRDEAPWTQDVVPFAKGLVPEYLSAEDEAEMMPCYEDFAERYGLLLGPAVCCREATAAATPRRAAAWQLFSRAAPAERDASRSAGAARLNRDFERHPFHP